MRHLRRLSLAVAIFLFVVPIGIVTAIFKSLAFALEEVVDAEVMLLNWFFTDKEDTFGVVPNYDDGRKPPEDEDHL